MVCSLQQLLPGDKLIDSQRLVSLPLMEETPVLTAPSEITLEAQARLDEKITAATLTLCDLRTQRNAWSAVSRLPPEILATIFIFCACGYQQLHYPQYGVPTWVNVSYVCRRWRDIALSCSTLWSFLFVSSRHWTDELLARSKKAPLAVSMNSAYAKNIRELDLLEKASQHTDRIKTFNLQLTRPEAKGILSLFCSPAPLLQNLRISVERGNYYREPPLLPGALFDGNTPVLRILELVGYYIFPLISPTLCGLTFLRLCNFDTSSQPKLAELKTVLNRMQDLEYLHLENALPSARGIFAGQSVEGSEKLSLPRLSRLSIIAPFSTVIFLLTRSDIPLKTEVRLRCCFEEGADDHTLIYPILARRFIACEGQEVAHVPTIRTCFIETASETISFAFRNTVEHDSGRRAFLASPWPNGLYELREEWNRNIPLKVDIETRSTATVDREDIIRGVCRSIPLASLGSAHFNLDMGVNLSPAFWTQTFGHFQELRHIKLSQVMLQGLIQALRNPQEGDPPSCSIRVFAPALEELEFCDVEFSEECQVLDSSEGCSCVDCLGKALSDRKAGGYGLRQLIFAGCFYIYGSGVESLRKSVTEVKWDGITRSHPDSESEEERSEYNYDEDPYYDPYYDDFHFPFGW